MRQPRFIQASRRLPAASGRWCLLLLFVVGCTASPPILDVPEPLPSSIETYRHIDVHAANPFFKDTGIRLEKGTPFTILAKGKYPHNWLLMRVGNERLWSCPVNITRKAEHTGHLSVKVRRGSTYDDPNYSIDLIVWATEDYSKIADFLRQAHARRPADYAIEHAYADVRLHGRIFLEEKQTREEIESTRQAIQALQSEAGKAPGSEKASQVRLLEARLEQLTARLEKLTDLRRQLEDSQARTTQLGRRLQERKQREQQLLARLEEADKRPPLLIITNPADGHVTEAQSVFLRGAAEDDTGIEEIEVFVDGRRRAGENVRGIEPVGAGGTRDLTFEHRVGLKTGKNRIRVRAVDDDGLFTEKVLTVERKEIRRNVWAVIAGINAYPELRRLKYAVNDARAFHDWLVNTSRVPEQNVTLLLDEQASLKRLRSALGTHLKSAADKDDLVIIYFAGHGAVERDSRSPDGDGLEKYLLPYDADPADLYATALPMREVAHIVHRIRSERLVFLADTCYSGASGGRTIRAGGIRANLSDAFLTRLAEGKGKIIITASGANEVSVEKDDLGHGVFTYYLLEGLRGPADIDKDGLISVDEAYRYVSESVPRATGQAQHPVKKGTVEGRLLLGVVP